MGGLTFTVVAAVIGVIGTVSGVLLGWVGFSKSQRAQTQAEATSDALLRSDVASIKSGVDEIRVELKSQKKDLDVLAERVTRLEESAKQAHKRLDNLEK